MLRNQEQYATVTNLNCQLPDAHAASQQRRPFLRKTAAGGYQSRCMGKEYLERVELCGLHTASFLTPVQLLSNATSSCTARQKASASLQQKRCS